MPNIDGPHGFLTALLPLHTEPCPHPKHGGLTSPAHAVREILASLPTAQHSLACTASGQQSPFARSPTTHFARFAVIDDPAFNGRDPHDAILTAANLASDLLAAKPTDVLVRPYLLFCADFDVPAAIGDPIADYLGDLWSRMPDEWTAILNHCEGWRVETPGTAADFSAFIASAQVETTMPFNDYGIATGKAGPAPIRSILILASVLGTASAIGAGFAVPSGWLLRGFVALVAGFAVAVGIAASAISTRGSRGGPWSQGQDLASVLKALHVQAAFTRFAIAQQGENPASLQGAFKAFLAAERPADLDGPTQPPGVIPRGGGVAS